MSRWGWPLVLLLGLSLALGAWPQNARFSRIDAHALAAPASAEADVSTLARYLVAPCRNEEEKARAIFRWVADRISYDTQALFSRNFPDPSPDNVLRTRRAVCAGYSELYVALARAGGLQAEQITGLSKGYGYEADSKDRIGHAWNAVRIGGKWQLLDVTWGSGALNEEQKFQKRFNEFWFCTRPEQFVWDHYPTQSRWQLLSAPVSKAEFESLVKVTSYYFTYGLTAKERRGRLDASRKLELSIDAPQGTVMMASLMRDGRDPNRPLTFVQREGRFQVVRCMLPEPGQYSLRLYARPKGSQTYHWVMEYQVKAKLGYANAPGYPKVFLGFQDGGAQLVAPLDGRLTPDREVEFRLRVPNTEEVFVGDENHRTPLTASGNLFYGKVKPTSPLVRVYAREKDGSRYAGLLEYVVR